MTRLPDADWQHHAGVQAILTALGAADGDTRFVGGCVRDTLLGQPVSDVDLATRLRPDEVIRRLEAARIKAVPTGLAHGTVTAVSKGKPIEVTTLRRDVSTDGRHATVAFTDDWQADAARRDFTINALSAAAGNREVHDYFGGLADLEARRVRFIGDALTRIAEDHLRILRFFRFHARFGRGEPDGESLEACVARANDLMALSRERIAGELLRLLALPDPVPALRLMVERGVWRPVLPEIIADGVDMLSRTMRRETAAGLPVDPVRRLSALLPPDPELAIGVAARLRLSNDARARLALLAERGVPPITPEHLAFQVGRLSAVSKLILSGLPDEEMKAAVAKLDDWQKPNLPVKGGDLILMGLPPGPIVAQTLGAVQDQWCAAGFPDADTTRAMARAAVDHALRSRQ